MRNLAISLAVLGALPVVGALGALLVPGSSALGFLGRAAVIAGACLLAALLPAVVLSSALPTLMGPEDEAAREGDPFSVVLNELGKLASDPAAATSEGR